jgi:hypothetical protein
MLLSDMADEDGFVFEHQQEYLGVAEENREDRLKYWWPIRRRQAREKRLKEKMKDEKIR